MSLVVQKFGGSSVVDADRIRAVAEHVARTRRAGDDVVVVVSAMGKTTDELIRLADDVSSVQPAREVDMLLSAGERISMSLLCMALAGLGVEATSFTGSQAGIITDAVHSRAKILEIRAHRLEATLAGGGPGRGAGGRRLRDLHRRVRCVQRRSAHRARGPPAVPGELRGDARDLRQWWTCSDVEVRGVRPEPPGGAARSFEFLVGARHLGR